MSYTYTVSVWRDGELLATELESRATERDRTQLMDSYLVCAVIQGDSVTYSRPHDEFKITRTDGTVEYVKPHDGSDR